MPGGATTIQQQYDEYSFAQQFVFQQLVSFCHEFEEANQLKAQNLKLKEISNQQQQLEHQLFWSQIQYIIGCLSTVFLLLIIGLGCGILVGINIPDGAGCTSSNLLCRYLRLRQPKIDLRSQKLWIESIG